MIPNLSIGQLIAAVQLLEPTLSTQLVWGAEKVIQQFASAAQAGKQDIVFIAHSKYLKSALLGDIGALVVKPADWQLICTQNHGAELAASRNDMPEAVIVCDDPYAFFALASQVLLKHSLAAVPHHRDGHSSARPDIHPTALIHSSATVGFGAVIQAYAVIERDAVIGQGCVISSHCTVGVGVHIGAGSQLYSHVTLYHGVQIGARCIIHSGTVIGADGFGFAPYQKRWIKIPQTGTVVIGDDVEIGANCTIDRGALGDTRVGRGTKLDNLIQIAHNVIIGQDCAFAANIAIAGSAVIGNRVQMGGKAGVLGHLSVCDDVVISSCTLVTKTINTPGFYTGVYPMQDNAQWEKNAVSLKRLNDLRLQVRGLEAAINALVQVNTSTTE
jgi:UDP-3-O-[3-hydroxymyristoyl] glucosamine N-acyltransferase